MKVLNFFKKFFSIYIAVVIVCILIFTRFVGYQFRRNYACDYMWIFIADAIIVFLLFLLIKYLKNNKSKLWDYLHSNTCFKYVILISSIILFCLQLFIDAGAWFIVGWDTRNVIFPDMQMNSDYMSMYPNQIFLAGLYRGLYMLITQVFSLSFDNYYFVLVILSTLCVLASVVLCGHIAKKLSGPFIGLITYFAALLFLGLSPWIMVPYSDTSAMLFVVLTLFWYIQIKDKRLKWFLIFATSLIGYSIKPTAIFILFAILFLEICMIISKYKYVLKNINKQNATKFCINVAFAFLGLAISSLLTFAVCNYGVQIDENKSFTATHFLMMGINLENRGAWNADDVGISRSYDNVEEREAGNIKEWQHRLAVYGPFEVTFTLLNKTLTNFNDGSFAWEAEIPWCIENKGSNPLVWGYYGIDPADAHNDNNNLSAYPRQTLWYLILIGCVLSIFSKKIKREEYTLYLSLLAISAFLTICEPDPRYLILYLPFFILVSIKGWQSAYLKFGVFYEKFS